MNYTEKIFNYLKDKFPKHKLYEYEEAAAFLSYLMIVEVNDQVNDRVKNWFKKEAKKR